METFMVIVLIISLFSIGTTQDNPERDSIEASLLNNAAASSEDPGPQPPKLSPCPDASYPVIERNLNRLKTPTQATNRDR